MGLPRTDCSHHRPQSSGLLLSTSTLSEGLQIIATASTAEATASSCCHSAATETQASTCVRWRPLRSQPNQSTRVHAKDKVRPVQVVARYHESCAVVRDKNMDPELLTDRQQPSKAAGMHQERVLVHRHAALAPTMLTLSCIGHMHASTKYFSAFICNHMQPNPVLRSPSSSINGPSRRACSGKIVCLHHCTPCICSHGLLSNFAAPNLVEQQLKQT